MSLLPALQKYKIFFGLLYLIYNNPFSNYICNTMRGKIIIPIKCVTQLANQLCLWSRKEPYSLVLNSNDLLTANSAYSKLSQYQILAAFGATEIFSPTSGYLNALSEAEKLGDWLFGYLGYDLKNEIANLTSSNPDGLHFPKMLFFRPAIVFAVQNNILTIHYSKSKFSEQTANSYFEAITTSPVFDDESDTNIVPKSRFTKEEYIATVESILSSIQQGNILGINLCQEFFANNCNIDPYETYIKLNSISPTPFSAFGKFNNKFLICASPERYLQKYATTLVTQPIKGTSPRGKSDEEDKQIVEKLLNDPKERAENIMIVDLVQNELSQVAQAGSVKFDELCGVYPFKQVHQMISTVSCQVEPNFGLANILKHLFPMGSMTGVPKVEAMKLIDEYERSQRGLYSGSVGYIDPAGNFDFNVVIRSLLYNQTNKYLSYTVGGAITSQSNPHNEYNECLLKAKAIIQALTSK